LTNDNGSDRDRDDTVLELVEIDLLYATAELMNARNEPAALRRALQHIAKALEMLRAERSSTAA